MHWNIFVEGLGCRYRKCFSYHPGMQQLKQVLMCHTCRLPDIPHCWHSNNLLTNGWWYFLVVPLRWAKIRTSRPHGKSHKVFLFLGVFLLVERMEFLRKNHSRWRRSDTSLALSHCHSYQYSLVWSRFCARSRKGFRTVLSIAHRFLPSPLLI